MSNALREIAEIYIEASEAEKAINFLTKAHIEAEEIDFIEEKVRALIQIATHFIEVERKDKTIEILAEARSTAETIQGFNRKIFWQISVSVFCGREVLN